MKLAAKKFLALLLAAMLLLGYPPRALCFYAGGIKLVPCRRVVPRGRQTVILAAGCAVNAALAGVSYAAGLGALVYVNLAVCLLNLLPLSCLDGGRLLMLYLPERARKTAAALTVLPLCIAAAVISPPSAVMIALFAAASETVMDTGS